MQAFFSSLTFELLMKLDLLIIKIYQLPSLTWVASCSCVHHLPTVPVLQRIFICNYYNVFSIGTGVGG